MTPRQAQRVLEARRMRIAQIRKTVATLSIVIFVALFSTIYVQMATGRDPALGAQAGTTKTAGTTRSASQPASDDSSSDQNSPGSGSATAPSATLTPMTTSQS